MSSSHLPGSSAIFIFVVSQERAHRSSDAHHASQHVLPNGETHVPSILDMAWNIKIGIVPCTDKTGKVFLKKVPDTKLLNSLKM